MTITVEFDEAEGKMDKITNNNEVCNNLNKKEDTKSKDVDERSTVLMDLLRSAKNCAPNGYSSTDSGNDSCDEDDDTPSSKYDVDDNLIKSMSLIGISKKLPQKKDNVDNATNTSKDSTEKSGVNKCTDAVEKIFEKCDEIKKTKNTKKLYCFVKSAHKSSKSNKSKSEHNEQQDKSSDDDINAITDRLSKTKLDNKSEKNDNAVNNQKAKKKLTKDNKSDKTKKEEFIQRGPTRASLTTKHNELFYEKIKISPGLHNGGTAIFSERQKKTDNSNLDELFAVIEAVESASENIQYDNKKIGDIIKHLEDNVQTDVSIDRTLSSPSNGLNAIDSGESHSGTSPIYIDNYSPTNDTFYFNSPDSSASSPENFHFSSSPPYLPPEREDRVELSNEHNIPNNDWASYNSPNSNLNLNNNNLPSPVFNAVERIVVNNNPYVLNPAIVNIVMPLSVVNPDSYINPNIPNGNGKPFPCCADHMNSATETLKDKYESLDTNLKKKMFCKIQSLTVDELKKAFDGYLSDWKSLNMESQHLLHFYAICTRLLTRDHTMSKFFEVYDNGHNLLDRAVLTCWDTPLIAKYLAECMWISLPFCKNQNNQSFDTVDTGPSVLHRAVKQGGKCAMALAGIISLNSRSDIPVFDINRFDRGSTPLLLACQIQNHTKINSFCSCELFTHILLKHGEADPNVKEWTSGDTPLHKAVNPHTPCTLKLVKLLLEHNADATIKNYDKLKPIDFVRRDCDSSLEVYNLLKNWNRNTVI